MVNYVSDVRIDLKQLVQFFRNYQKMPMPRMIREIALSGGGFKFGDLETAVIEWRQLNDLWSPKIAKKINAPTTAYNIPLVHRVRTPEYRVYDPISGTYLGRFDIK